MYVMHRYRLDAHSVDVEAGVGVSPGDDLRVDGPLDEGLVGEETSLEYCSSVVAFFFFEEG